MEYRGSFEQKGKQSALEARIRSFESFQRDNRSSEGLQSGKNTEERSTSYKEKTVKNVSVKELRKRFEPGTVKTSPDLLRHSTAQHTLESKLRKGDAVKRPSPPKPRELDDIPPQIFSLSEAKIKRDIEITMIGEVIESIKGGERKGREGRRMKADGIEELKRKQTTTSNYEKSGIEGEAKIKRSVEAMLTKKVRERMEGRWIKEGKEEEMEIEDEEKEELKRKQAIALAYKVGKVKDEEEIERNIELMMGGEAGEVYRHETNGEILLSNLMREEKKEHEDFIKKLKSTMKSIEEKYATDELAVLSEEEQKGIGKVLFQSARAAKRKKPSEHAIKKLTAVSEEEQKDISEVLLQSVRAAKLKEFSDRENLYKRLIKTDKPIVSKEEEEEIREHPEGAREDVFDEEQEGRKFYFNGEEPLPGLQDKLLPGLTLRPLPQEEDEEGIE